jgi:hypothetical protein
LYYASVDESARVGCSLLLQAMGALPYLYNIPEVVRRESKSPPQLASVNVVSHQYLWKGKICQNLKNLLGIKVYFWLQRDVPSVGLSSDERHNLLQIGYPSD